MITWEDITEDRERIPLAPCDRPNAYDGESVLRFRFRNMGYCDLRNFMPHDLIDEYAAVRAEHGEYPGATAYLDCPQMERLATYSPLMEKLEEIIGEPCYLHLTLNGWTSTERNWHQDGYLNPPEVGTHYLACWFALDEIDPRSGPFEFVPFSHLGRVMTREAVLRHATEDERSRHDWPKTTERYVVPAVEQYIASDKVLQPQTFIPASKGDVLIWHSCLLHRGSTPAVPGMERRALIAHYSGIDHRPDMPHRDHDRKVFLP